MIYGGILVIFFLDFRLRHTFQEWIYAEITGDWPRQPSYEIKL